MKCLLLHTPRLQERRITSDDFASQQSTNTLLLEAALKMFTPAHPKTTEEEDEQGLLSLAAKH